MTVSTDMSEDLIERLKKEAAWFDDDDTFIVGRAYAKRLSKLMGAAAAALQSERAARLKGLEKVEGEEGLIRQSCAETGTHIPSSPDAQNLLDHMANALCDGVRWFREYEKHHAAKPDPEKAARNRQRKERLQAAVDAYRAGSAPSAAAEPLNDGRPNYHQWLLATARSRGHPELKNVTYPSRGAAQAMRDLVNQLADAIEALYAAPASPSSGNVLPRDDKSEADITALEPPPAVQRGSQP